jgi:MFS family permease
MGVMLGAINVVFTPLLLRMVPRGELGRISSLVNTVSQTASLGSIAISGLLVSAWLGRDDQVHLLNIGFGPVDSIYLCCGLLFLLGGMHVLHRIGDPVWPAATNSCKVPVPGGGEDQP